MKTTLGLIGLVLCVAGCAGRGQSGADREQWKMSDSDARAMKAGEHAKWAVNATNIEACSCPMFCQCYLTGQPALHAKGADADKAEVKRYCRFNNAFKVNQGHWDQTRLDGLKFWMAGDLGGDFSKGQMDWGVLTFEPSATPAQREAVRAYVKKIFPVKWNSFTEGRDAKIDWSVAADGAEAKLDGGKAAEMVLRRNAGADPGQPIVLHNVKFWAAPRNDGFKMMANQIEAYRLGEQPFEYKGTNGFVTTLDMNANDAADAKPETPPSAGAGGAEAIASSCCGG